MSMREKWAGWVVVLLAGAFAGPALAQYDLPGWPAQVVETNEKTKAQTPGDRETPAEKIRKALRQKAEFDYTAQDFQDLVDHLRTKTGLNVVLDPMVAQNMIGLGIRVAGGPGPNVPAVEFKGRDATSLHQALQRVLALHTLAYVVLDDAVLITFEEDAVSLQIGQRVHVKVEEVPLHRAIKDLARSCGVNIVIDPRVKQEASAPVSLDVENTSVENAVRLLAEIGGLKSVLSDNVLFVTSEARASKMRSETPPPAKSSRSGPGGAPAVGNFAPPPPPPNVMPAVPVPAPPQAD